MPALKLSLPAGLAQGRLGQTWASLSRVPPLVWLSALLIAFTLWASIAPATLVAYDPLETDLANVLMPFTTEHWLGTDEIGRDLYSRLVHGARESFLIGLLAMLVAIVLALPLGFLGALAPRPVRHGVDRLIEILLGFPTLLVALLFVTLLGQDPLNVAIAVGIGSAPGYARLIRGQTLLVRNSAYVEAAVALGHTRAAILFRHIVPNAIRPLVPITGLGVGKAIVWSSSLSFLGLGVKPPSSEWGALLAAGKGQLLEAPWLLVVPGTAVVLVALSFSTLFHYLQARSEGA
ncbi:Binding-protein-dependent transport systems inner membrane component [Azotobacter vinelandii CA]|uniref:Binding-protein-dependent transport systems inner membrane component n=2 Tax=Azotobacter vinelandii TaxID=354 RepID=C1DHN4_AZOVD|nr:ABC transporter permease [Azotobacter vinelandii]ACO78629.1 Binding-protein-dependent transport systems inner membrane component [Azotobacter vinelandii DJ]AGK16684.1 Binding-protein-dependent transport systems inner membrane component [Azotobacter vinelandii CA]AGK20611.1 Binding-protein-dependent transport systems inner membrane component [Azotobacter vinelandii CA6]SFX90393.1 peptide/nickel transport system permease protein [Azotobacter vinelandii]GLK58203.1 ABC transporter permease [Azo